MGDFPVLAAVPRNHKYQEPFRLHADVEQKNQKLAANLPPLF